MIHYSYRSNEYSFKQLQCLLVSGVAKPVKLTSPDSTSEHEHFTKYVLEFENVIIFTKYVLEIENVIIDGMVLSNKEDGTQLPIEWLNTILIDPMKIYSASYSV